MSADLDPRDDLTDRLAALGRRPVDPALQSEHLTALAGVHTGSTFRNALAGRLKIGAGVLAGFLIGATGLTTAGAMGPLQPIAADVVEAVAPVDVPKGKSDEAKAKAKAAKANGNGNAKAAKDVDGKGSIGTARNWDDGCVEAEGGGYAGNRGLYLKQERAKGADAFAAAKATDCGKPLTADDTEPEAEVEELEAPKTDEEKGKTSAPGQAEGAERGQSEERKAAAADKREAAPQGGKPETVPPAAATENADDDAQLPESRTPGASGGAPADAGDAPADGAGDADADV